jgi:WD40 repeat protein
MGDNMVWSPDSIRLATIWGENGAIWATTNGQLLSSLASQTSAGIRQALLGSLSKSLYHHGSFARFVRKVWSPDGTRLITTSDDPRDQLAQVWDAASGASGQLLVILPGYPRDVTPVTFSALG